MRTSNDGFVGSTNDPQIGDVLAPISSNEFFTNKKSVVIERHHVPASSGHDPYPGYLKFTVAELADDNSYPESLRIVVGNIGTQGISGPRTVVVLRQMKATWR